MILDTYILSSIVTLIAIGLLYPLAHLLDWRDHPDSRKLHGEAIPLIGGLAIYIAIMVLMLKLAHHPVYLMIATTLVVLMGAIDDKFSLSPLVRLIGQTLAAYLLIQQGLLLEQLGAIVGPNVFYTQGMAVPLTIFSIMCLQNLANMIDGLDGLLASQAIITLIALATLQQSIHFDPLLYATLAALVVFGLFNHPWRRRLPRIFLGDAGSMLVGLLLAWFTISSTQGNKAYTQPVIMLYTLAIPLMDFATVILQRVINGQHPLKARRDHLHHRLIDCGLSAAQVVLLMGIASILFCLFGVTAHRLHYNEMHLFQSFLALFLIYFYAVPRLKKLKSGRKRSAL